MAMDSDTEILVSNEPEADVDRDPLTSSQDESQAEAEGILQPEGILQQIDSVEGEVVFPVVRRNRAISRAFEALDGVNLEEVFRDRALVMKTSSFPQRCLSRCAVWLAMQKALSQTRSEVSRVRAWKLFLLLPRILLFRSGRGGLIPKNMPLERFASFAEGQWIALLRQGQEAAEAHKAGVLRRRHRQVDSVEKRAERAQALVELGELSSARQALEGATCAPGDDTTGAALTNPARRPPRIEGTTSR